MSTGRRNIQVLRVKCENPTCKWKGTVATLKMHLEKCKFTLLPCPNQCQDNSDNIVHLMRKDLPHHLERDCPNRDYECQHCGEMGTFTNISLVHDKICEKKIVPCPNADCTETMPRKDIEKHLSTECTVACKYANIGCRKISKREKMAVHEELDDKIHLFLAINTINELKKVLRDSMTFKLTGFYGEKSEDQTFYSPSFYTSPQGYHMKMRVDPNGCGASKGTHISVYAKVLDGKYDDDITWPFQGKVTLDLLNQLENTNHYTRNILSGGPGNEDKYNKHMRPGGTGLGTRTFIPHSQLGRNPAKNTQYLKDDTLYFRVSIHTPHHKPWLQCTD